MRLHDVQRQQPLRHGCTCRQLILDQFNDPAWHDGLTLLPTWPVKANVVAAEGLPPLVGSVFGHEPRQAPARVVDQPPLIHHRRFRPPPRALSRGPHP